MRVRGAETGKDREKETKGDRKRERKTGGQKETERWQIQMRKRRERNKRKYAILINERQTYPAIS